MRRGERSAWSRAVQARIDGTSEPRRRSAPVPVEGRHLEALIARAALAWWGSYLAHWPNERADPAERVILSRRGVRRGLPDLWLFLPRGGSPAAVVELKAPGRRPSADQECWLALLELCGFTVLLLDGWTAAFDALDGYAGARRDDDPPPPLREALPSLAGMVVARRAASPCQTDRLDSGRAGGGGGRRRRLGAAAGGPT